MSYRLGIDLGTTFTAAALTRATAGGAGEPEIVALGGRSAAVPSVLYLPAAGPLLVGDAAERRELTDPDRVARRFKRRIGDDVPLVLGDAVHTAHDLAARLGRWVVDRVAEREGGPAERIAFTHPASWGEHKRELFARALRDVGLGRVVLLTEPQAAAVSYAAKERVAPGSAVAVYDLGGGTFDSAVVRKGTTGFDLPGRPAGIDQLGGTDFDDRVVDHVRTALGSAFTALDIDDPDVASALAHLRRECIEAKEALSVDTEVTIPVMLPGLRTHARLVRAEFEAMIRGSLDHTVDALRSAVSSAGLAPSDLRAVLLVGGSSRIPLVSRMVSEGLGRPVAVDADPKTSIALGAALALAPHEADRSASATTRVLAGAPTGPPSRRGYPPPPPPTAVTTRVPVPAPTPTPQDRDDGGDGTAGNGRGPRRRALVALAALLAVATAGLLAMMLTGGGTSPSSTLPSTAVPAGAPPSTDGATSAEPGGDDGVGDGDGVGGASGSPGDAGAGDAGAGGAGAGDGGAGVAPPGAPPAAPPGAGAPAPPRDPAPAPAQPETRGAPGPAPDAGAGSGPEATTTTVAPPPGG